MIGATDWSEIRPLVNASPRQICRNTSAALDPDARPMQYVVLDDQFELVPVRLLHTAGVQASADAR